MMFASTLKPEMLKIAQTCSFNRTLVPIGMHDISISSD